ncbi:hypothetical protein SBC1_52540 (plasmid) [Caballeronia sp. SBC1]|nr:hypothetical protein SBC2_53800 [Caballeronia sp. SBC2]QIN65209.1 hypothetical protein SBC1_52540 [Caballeronia sp. SBC1]
MHFGLTLSVSFSRRRNLHADRGSGRAWPIYHYVFPVDLDAVQPKHNRNRQGFTIYPVLYYIDDAWLQLFDVTMLL